MFTDLKAVVKIHLQISRYRLKDNYLRFYLKYIDPVKDKIQTTRVPLKAVDHLSNWNIIAGFQFENLVLNHLPEILEQLNINLSSIISVAPYVQRKKTRNKGACQIDLLIVCKHKTLYVCEIKYRQSINLAIVKEVQRKIEVFEGVKSYSIRPVLIYAGEVDKNCENELCGYFDKMISIEEIIG
ncbi:MAG: DUF234 domain-containing protein [Pseudobdellovibrionaceae bacterium]